MRMWMVSPDKMCRKHLLGEHVELHMLVGSLNRNKSIQGFLDKGLLEPQNIQQRHDVLVQEMKNRGYKHNSPLPDFHTDIVGEVSVEKSESDLKERCEVCREAFLG